MNSPRRRRRLFDPITPILLVVFRMERVVFITKCLNMMDEERNVEGLNFTWWVLLAPSNFLTRVEEMEG